MDRHTQRVVSNFLLKGFLYMAFAVLAFGTLYVCNTTLERSALVAERKAEMPYNVNPRGIGGARARAIYTRGTVQVADCPHAHGTAEMLTNEPDRAP